MTLPGLALFYGGLVRKKNVLSVLAQCFLITGLTTILWIICGYGMIFGGDGTATGPLGMTHDWVKGIVGNPERLLDVQGRHFRAESGLLLLGVGKRVLPCSK